MTPKTQADSTAMDEHYMAYALEEACLASSEGEVPVGAVVVFNGEIIARAHNMVEALKQGSAHAELLAINAASRALDAWRLDGCTLYVTKEPCPMCAGAMVCCRVPRLVFGSPDSRTGAAGGAFSITAMPNALHTVDVTSGILQEQCLAVIQDFFRRRRKEASKRQDAKE